MKNVVIHNEYNEHTFDNIDELAKFLERDYASVYNSLYKITHGLRKNSIIRNWDGDVYTVDYVNFVNSCSHNSYNVVYTVCNGDITKEMTTLKGLVRYIQELRDEVSSKTGSKLSIKIEMRNIHE